MIHYILQILAFQLLFLVVYDLLLKKETFFNWNRAYLLVTHVLSFVLPLVQIEVIQKSIPKEYQIQLPAILIGSANKEISLPEVLIGSSDTFFQFITISKVFEYLWYLGMLISLFLFTYKIITILKLKQKGIKTRIDNFNLISLPNTSSAFTFFNTIFLGESLSETKKTNILLHEKIHVKEYHSADLLFFEVLRIIFWFNPLVYIYQNRMATLQEYIADAKAIAETDEKEYYQNLLSQIFQTERVSFINTFFNHSLIKNRIVMLQKSKSKKIFQLKYLLLVPIICSMLVYTSCTQDSVAQTDNASKSDLIKKIEAVHHQIEIQGNISEEEEKALKLLAMLTTKNGVSNPAYKDVVKDAEIPFGVIEKVPGFPGCEGLVESESKKCFTQKITQFVGSEFNTKLGDELELTGIQRIYVRFKINHKGKIVDVKARGPQPELETEAIRVIQKLPQMTPGVHDGVNVGVMYSLPIAFEIKE
ncbi:M56 family metallopeptidase [Aquimarina sp. MMG016]|uniref:M56 family metallopeptidase n=1 Tax=Aquimarina sp. MMG016 TaxID=2822690 RepID=UPI001B3A0220|nr:M56 family metallopeptidase [Aquimarina sp. MMG016]MBQ4822128.1 energy transducer TonB [Aquimarina sp. MMG016]